MNSKPATIPFGIVACPLSDNLPRNSCKHQENWNGTERAGCFVVRNYESTASVGAILDELGWKSLQGRRKARRLCILYKLHYDNLAADRMPQLIPMPWASSHLKFSNAYKIQYSRTNYHKYLFFSCTIREWNSLPEDIATLQNLDSFKKSSISMTVSFCVFIFVYRFIYLFIYLLLKTLHKNLHFWRRWGFVVEEEEKEEG